MLTHVTQDPLQDPLAIKKSFNVDTEHIAGHARAGTGGLLSRDSGLAGF